MIASAIFMYLYLVGDKYVEIIKIENNSSQK